MFKNILIAYKELGYKIGYAKGYTTTHRAMALISNVGELKTGLGINLSDIIYFMMLRDMMKCNSIFIIGNAFGYSTFVLAELFPQATIDVIDAEIEGECNSLGSEITRKIANKYYPNVQLTTGYSPKDLHKSMRKQEYDLIFIDGKHTIQQLKADFKGCEPFASNKSVFYLHDVKFSKMEPAVESIKGTYPDWKCYFVPFSVVGSVCFVRNINEICEWMEAFKYDTVINKLLL